MDVHFKNGGLELKRILSKIKQHLKARKVCVIGGINVSVKRRHETSTLKFVALLLEFPWEQTGGPRTTPCI